MENMEEKIMDVLGDPEKLSQIMDIAKGLGFSPPADDATAAAEPEPEMTGAIMGLLQKMNAPNGKRDALMHALMPYLQPNRQKKLQRALQVAKMSKIAGAALKNYSEQI